MKNKTLTSTEFLFTYGWAILAFILAIGLLGYFGFLKPTGYVVGSATVSLPFYIDAQRISPTGVSLEIENKGPQDYLITNVYVEGCGNNEVSSLIEKDASLIKNIPCTLINNRALIGNIIITYRDIGSSIDLYSKGRINEKVRI